MKIHAPCKDCPDRVLGCHSKCERYSEYKKKISQVLTDEKLNTEKHLNQITAVPNGRSMQKKQ